MDNVEVANGQLVEFRLVNLIFCRYYKVEQNVRKLLECSVATQSLNWALEFHVLEPKRWRLLRLLP